MKKTKDCKAEIWEAKRWMDRHGNHYAYWSRVGPKAIEQTGHGTTMTALAAWAQLRQAFKGNRVMRVAGLVDYAVPDMDGRRTVKTPALMIEDGKGTRLYLTGCTWGYGGEGPRGTVAILCDIGIFGSDKDAEVFVQQKLKADEPWDMEKVMFADGARHAWNLQRGDIY